MRRLLLVANPAASGFTASLHHEVVGTLRDGFTVTPVWPDGPEEAEQEARDAAADGFDVVAAMGGDGVVHRVANGLVGTDTSLAVVPAGTTNVFARLVGYPRKAGRSARCIADSTRHLLHPTVTITMGSTIRAAVFAAGVGFDADVIRRSDERPLRKVGFGSIHYLRSAFSVALSKYRGATPRISLRVDEEQFSCASALVQVSDVITYLGRRPLSVSARGGPAVLAVARATPGRLIRLLGRAATGRRVDALRGARVWPGFVSMSLDAPEPVPCEVDGELFGDVTSMQATPRPASLRVVDPRPGSDTDPEV